VLPEQGRFGSGVKKPESGNLQSAKTPDVGAPDARESDQAAKNPADQQARERLGKPPPEGVRGEVQLEPIHHQEYRPDSLDELRQLARRVLRPPLSPEQLEGVKPENFEEWARNHPYHAANYASAMQHYEEAVENLAQPMLTDPLKFTSNLLRRILREREGRSKPPEK
jgi:hypothetical protein